MRSWNLLTVTKRTFDVAAARIPVRESGLHHVFNAELAAALELDSAQLQRLVQRRRLELTAAGETIAWKASPARIVHGASRRRNTLV